MTTYVNGPRIAFNHERLTTITASTGLTESEYAVGQTTTGAYDLIWRAQEVHITIEVAAIKYTVDGTTPTTTATTGIGHIAYPGDVIEIHGYQNITQFRAINEVASNGAVLQITYFRG